MAVNAGTRVATLADLWLGSAQGWSTGTERFRRRRRDQRLVHHSDRSAVYTSLAFSTRLAELEPGRALSRIQVI